MPRQFQPVEFNTFIGGLVTEATPLNFPNNASLDEENFVLNHNGSRSRRLGMVFEDGYQIIDSDQGLVNGQLVTSSFKWSNAGGLSTNTIICVQIGASIDFFDASGVSVSPNKLYTYTFTNLTNIVRFSFAIVDGILVVTTGGKDVCVFTYDTTQLNTQDAISCSTTRLLVRDLFGLDAFDDAGHNLRLANYIGTRPKTNEVTPSHIYNLRNQGWAIPYPHWDNDDYRQDVITLFTGAYTNGCYPSNADNITEYLTQNTAAQHGANLTLTRYNAQNQFMNGPTNTYSPIGSFIIDALDRGTSRVAAIQNNQANYNMNSLGLYELAIQALASYPDSTPTGALCCCSFAGRAWFGGFSGEVIGGDTHSPKLSSYLLYSQLVNDPSNISLCYQAADPTDHNDSALVDTDGGFLRMEGAYNIIGMAQLQSTLFVFAENGVWMIAGGAGGGFTATNYTVSQLTTSGCISQGSIVVMQDSIFYWGLDGIYSILRNAYGEFAANNITNKTIKTFFMDISNDAIRAAEGTYDSYANAVKWIYNNYIGATDDPIELCLDTITGAYYRHRIKAMPNGNGYPLLVRGIPTDPYRISYNTLDVINHSGYDVITSDGSQVETQTAQQITGVEEIIYLVLTGIYTPE